MDVPRRTTWVFHQWIGDSATSSSFAKSKISKLNSDRLNNSICLTQKFALFSSDMITSSNGISKKDKVESYKSTIKTDYESMIMIPLPITIYNQY